MSHGGLADHMRRQGLDPGTWSNGPGDHYAPHEHAFDKVVTCAAGSISFGLPDLGEVIELVLGDRLDLPAGVRHDAVVGPQGVTCLEAHLPAGRLAGPRRLPAGAW